MNNISIHETKVSLIAEAYQNTDVERSHSIDTNIELYSAGFFDGLTGLNAELPHFKDYWSGYQLGYREYCCGLLGVEMPHEEISTDAITISLTA